MLRSKTRYSLLILGLLLLGSLLLAQPPAAEAGILDANNQVTYKEYWIHHDEFTGGCNDDGTPTHPGGTFYAEPWTLQKCPKTMEFELPDDFSNAQKVEVYLDLWRAYADRGFRFKLNDGPTVYVSPVGYDWSRTPWVLEVDKSELDSGPNTITFWADRPTHVHDVGFRIYHTNDNPLLPGPGSDVEPPTGQLISIEDDGDPVSPDAGGTLMVNGDQLKLIAEASADTAFVEFHAWYEGYDEDNDGVFRDWHNLGRNNWFPGGRGAQATGGIINHIGTVKPKNGVATITWNLAHVTNQPVMRFKIRVVDVNGNVREGAGGISADFKLMRAGGVNAYVIHGFKDFGLHMDGKRPDSTFYDFPLPATVTTYFNQGYLVGAYWNNPGFSINSSPTGPVGATDWALGIKPLNMSYFLTGNNRITYTYNGGIGQFIEYPGPMFVFRRTTAGADNTPPAVSGQIPAPNANNIDVKSAVVARLGDNQFGVDWTTIKFSFNGEDVTNQTRIQGVMGDYRLVYDPPGDLPFATSQTVKIEACDLVGNCMSPVTYSFTTAAADETPPVISNVVVVTLPNGANITWNTNEPATSIVDYGKTTSYDLGPFENTTLKTSHTAEIRGLQPDTLYHFRIRGADEQGNTAQINDDTFRTLEFGSILSDDFNTCALDTSLWQEVDPQGDMTWTLSGETLTMNVPAGTAHDWTTGGPPRFMQLASNSDFMVEAKFESTIATLGQAQGILVEEDADTYVRVSFENSAQGPIMFVRFVKDGATLKSFSKTFVSPTPVPSALRVKRTGDAFDWYYLENNLWKKFTGSPYTMVMTPIKVGFFAATSGASGTVPGHTAVVDYFFNTDLPIIPEDGAPMSVNLDVVGTGTVTKLPDKSKYLCGEQVVLSASTVPGWSFAGWSGDLTGDAPTISTTIDSPKNVTATFTQDQYTLNVVLNNGGVPGAPNAVTRNPDKPTYVYGDVVELTAVPAPGWTFLGWTGAVAGTSPTISITMLKSETVTATFQQEHYDLDVNLFHNGIGTGGTVTITPVKSNYVYGDVVTLAATVNPGWTFGGWSGDHTASELETQVTITDDTAVTATFNQNHYEVNVNVIGAGGEVTLDPQKEFYLHGDVVALVADGDACWSFNQWSGDLTGSNPVEVVTITDDLDVTALFTENEYTLTVNKVGPGNVAISPSQAEYTCGEEITLNAVPAPGNFFAGWSGDLTGAENPLTFAIEKNMVVTATFTNNPPPTVDAIADKTANITTLITFAVHATDPQGEPLTLSATDLPPGATFTDNGNGNGTFTWRPSITQAGQYTITFIGSDGIGQGSTTVTITVRGMAIVLPTVIR